MTKRTNDQTMRDGALCAMLSLAVVLYHHALSRYLSELDRPLFLEIGFLTSLAIACLYEFQKDVQLWRYALIGCLVNALVFLCGAWVARWFRVEYIGFIESLKDNVELAEWLGHDLHEALTTRYVGYAGCFASGLLLMRLTAGAGVTRRLLNQVFVLPNNRPNSCRCCGQPIPAELPAESCATTIR